MSSFCKKHLIIATMSFVLLACAEQTSKPLQLHSDQSDFCPKVSSKVVADCTKKGGTLQKQGKAQCYTCTIEYHDAGKVCMDSVDCLGDCYNYGTPPPSINPIKRVPARRTILFLGAIKKSKMANRLLECFV